MSEKLVNIYKAKSAAEKNILKSKLESFGIRVVIRDIPGTGRVVQLQVRESDAEKATELIRDSLKKAPEAKSIPAGMVTVRLFEILSDAYICQEKLDEAGIKGSRVQDTDIKRRKHIALVVMEHDLERAKEILAKETFQQSRNHIDNIFFLGILSCFCLAIGIIVCFAGHNLIIGMIFLGAGFVVTVVAILVWIRRIRKKQAMEQKP
jgi:hypothetical protein